MAWYVKFDGIDGSSTFANHIHWTNATSVNIGGSKPSGVGTGTGRGRGTGQAPLPDISIGVINDRGMPQLLQAAVKGTVFKKVEIHGTATSGDAGEHVFMKIELENVIITSYKIGVLDNNSATNDAVFTISFEKYKTTYTQYGADGKNRGNVEYEWKVEQGES